MEAKEDTQLLSFVFFFITISILSIFVFSDNFVYFCKNLILKTQKPVEIYVFPHVRPLLATRESPSQCSGPEFFNNPPGGTVLSLALQINKLFHLGRPVPPRRRWPPPPPRRRRGFSGGLSPPLSSRGARALGSCVQPSAIPPPHPPLPHHRRLRLRLIPQRSMEAVGQGGSRRGRRGWCSASATSAPSTEV